MPEHGMYRMEKIAWQARVWPPSTAAGRPPRNHVLRSGAHRRARTGMLAETPEHAMERPIFRSVTCPSLTPSFCRNGRLPAGRFACRCESGEDGPKGSIGGYDVSDAKQICRRGRLSRTGGHRRVHRCRRRGSSAAPAGPNVHKGICTCLRTARTRPRDLLQRLRRSFGRI